MSSAALPAASYTRFLLGSALWFLAFGLQSVVFPWLVVAVLQESPARVGLAQTLSLVPALPLLLVGGTLADRAEPRRLLVALHLAFALLCAALAALVAAGGLSYPRLLGFALAGGALSALQVPARDAQLYPIARASLSRGVVGANLATQGAQAAGGLAGAALAALGAPAVLLVQACLALAGALPVAALRGLAAAPAASHAQRPGPAGIAAAIRAAWRSPVLRPVRAAELRGGRALRRPLRRRAAAPRARRLRRRPPRDRPPRRDASPRRNRRQPRRLRAGRNPPQRPRAPPRAGLRLALHRGARRDAALRRGRRRRAASGGSEAPSSSRRAARLCFGSARRASARDAPRALRRSACSAPALLGSLLSGGLVGALRARAATLALQAAAMLACLALAALRSEVARL